MRNVLGSVLAVLGAAATLVSPWQGWYAGRHGSTYKFWEVFGNGITASKSGVTDSLFLIFLVTAVITVVGVLFRSRTLVLLGGIVAFGFAVLWMVRQGQAAGELVVSGDNRGLGVGVAWALGGGALMIVGGLLMGSRRVQATAVPAAQAGRPPADTAATRPDPEDHGSGDHDPEPLADTVVSPSTTFTDEEARMLGLHEDHPADSPTAIPTTKPPAR
jgi:hypothetical protein